MRKARTIKDYPLNVLVDVFGQGVYTMTSDTELTLDYLMSLNDFDDRDRVIFAMYYKKGQTNAQIAKEFGLSHGRPQQILVRIQRKFRSIQYASVLKLGITAYIANLRDVISEQNKMIMEMKSVVERQAFETKHLRRESVNPLSEWKYKSETITPNTRIEVMGLSARLFNCLRRAKIITVEDLLTYPDDFGMMSGLGDRCFDELKARCTEIGLPFNGAFSSKHIYNKERTTK